MTIKKLALTIPGFGEVIRLNEVSPTMSKNFTSLGDLVSQLLNLAFFLSGFAMFIYMSVGVYQYLLAGGDKEKLAKARARITWAIVGFIVVIGAYTASGFVQEIFPLQRIAPKELSVPVAPT